MNRKMTDIVLVLGVCLLSASSAMGEGPGTFFQKNLATCFYCEESNAIAPGLSITTPRMSYYAKRKANVPESDLNKVSLTDTTKDNNTAADKVDLRIAQNAPEPFKKMIKAYEAGDMSTAYLSARKWIEYQDHILQRTAAIESLIDKAKQELNPESLNTEKESAE